jgi:hypothetical protein
MPRLRKADLLWFGTTFKADANLVGAPTAVIIAVCASLLKANANLVLKANANLVLKANGQCSRRGVNNHCGGIL